MPRLPIFDRRNGPLLVTAVVALFCGAWLIGGFTHVYPHPVIGWLPIPVSAVLAGHACWTASRQADLDAETRRFWRHLAVACCFFVAGIVSNINDATGGPAPSQEIGMITLAGYLGTLGTAMWALLRLPSWQRGRGDWIRFGLDSGIVMLTVGAVVWNLTLRNHEQWVSQTGGAGAMLVIMAVAGLSMATFIKVAFAGAGRLDRRAIHILATGAALGGVLGAVSLLLAGRPYLSSALIAVPVAALAIHLSAISQQRAGNREPRPRSGRPRISVVPYFAVAITDTMLLTTGSGDPATTRTMETAAVALTALVVIRQIIALRENHGLLTTVDGHLNQLRDYQDRLTHQATHDSLTDAGNRTLFEEHTSRLLTAGGTFHVALLDLDDFKAVNDRLGHRIGDRLIQETSRRLTATLGPGALVTRLGGDEFALVLPGLPDHQDFAALVAAVGRPADLDGNILTPGASIGVTSVQPGDDPAELLRRADVAMYAAKAAGGQRWQWFDPRMDRAADDTARLAADLRGALAGDQFFVLYQPIVSLPDGVTTGAEVLLRWQHPERGLVPPDVFIPVAERTGVIHELGAWVFEQACRQSADWSARFGAGAPGRISVNVSARQLADPDFVDAVAATLRATGAGTDHLLLEVTETAVLNAETAIDQLNRLKALGLRIALDDFGTGHSSLSLLMTCPVDVLKVDKSFVSGDRAEDAGAIIVKNIIGFTTDFGIDAVAEGVETRDQAERLHAAGYRLAQGYLFGRPMSAEAFEATFQTAAVAA
ncbi:putative bifunctional diguanylate cyclase/phosphodiesterase [Actinoplanes awajinensis]|uniref:putative bifunctional diguanylate cyclase/phosphodiesterase n=1 Tax=Actinoplanes awajinensis TaxID=135946 RepID=UPI000B1719CA|nr:bifunctional diguanylate cyclase/phosphodiesterase [Actinoplanes awajinensis]